MLNYYDDPDHSLNIRSKVLREHYSNAMVLAAKTGRKR